ncbi:MAG TPA: FG-GAP-like repeat-containing protein [Pyrinomonadaceae bacterium]|nr:FG-GAP-like repeat-containing protein [Pyrinomonadaceae bacterium]
MPHMNKFRTHPIFILGLAAAVVGLISWRAVPSHSATSLCTTPGFSTPTNFAVGPEPFSVAVGDFNGDGKSDLVTANRGTFTSIAGDSKGISVLLGTGAGSFGTATHFPIGGLYQHPEPYSVAVGDFNNDGKSDIVTADSAAADVAVFLGTGGGSFQDSKNFNVGIRPVSVDVGDFNGDGNSDLATANRGGPGVSVLLGDGTGSFGAATDITFGNQPNSVATGDFNGDGKDDLAVTDSVTYNLSIMLSTGSGNFGTATNYSVEYPWYVKVSDLNGDRNSDLVVGQADNGVSILLGTGTGSFGEVSHFGAAAGFHVAIGDFNGDNKVDLVTTDLSDYYLAILLGTGTGSFGAPTYFTLPVGSSPRSVAASDFNGDGKSDLATANSGSDSVSILLSTCISSDSTPPGLTVPSTITTTATGPAGAIVTYSVSATDDLDPNPVISCLPQSGSTFVIGSTNVNCTATDASGNSVSDSFTVIVADAPPPPPPPPPPLLQRGVATGPITADDGVPANEADLRARSSHLFFKFVPFQPPARDQSTIGLIRKSRNGWVRLWADWPTLQPTADLSFDNIEIDPRTRPFIRSLDEQISAAQRDGFKVILTVHRFPLWANQNNPDLKRPFDRDLESLVPNHLGENSDWAKWIDFLIRRYGYSTATKDSLRYIDFLEVCNEPNLSGHMWPQRDGDGHLVIDNRVAQMFITAQKKVRNRDGEPEVTGVLDSQHPTTVKLAGPATSDTTRNTTRKSVPLNTDYQKFTTELLKRLKGRFVADKNFAWTHHNYGDIEQERVCSSSTRCKIGELNAAAWVRRRLVAGVDGYKWTGWPSGDNNPYILLTEGGVRLDAAYKRLRERKNKFKIRKPDYFDPVKDEQARLVQVYFNRLRTRSELSQGIGLITYYLVYSDPCFDTGLYDVDSLGLPLRKRERDCLKDAPDDYRENYSRIISGKKRPLYDTWSSLPSF